MVQALGTWRQGDQQVKASLGGQCTELEASLGYTRPYLKKKKKSKRLKTKLQENWKTWGMGRTHWREPSVSLWRTREYRWGWDRP